MSFPTAHFSFEFQLTGDHPILTNHHVHGRPLVPGVTWLGLICEALGAEGQNPSDFVLEDIVFREALALLPDDSASLRVFFDASDRTITISDAHSGTEHCRCRLALALDAGVPLPLPTIPATGAMIARPMEGVYASARGLDIVHGDWMQGRGTVYIGDDIVIADVHLGDEAASAGFALHPALLDCATVTPFAAGGFSLDHRSPAIPLAIGRLRIFGMGFTAARVICTQAQGAVSNSDIMHNDLWLVNEQGAPLVQIERLSAKRIRSANDLRGGAARGPSPKVTAPVNGASLQDQLVAFVEQATGRAIAGKADYGFYELGFDSGDLMGLASALENRLGQRLYPTLFYEHSSIEKLALWLRENGIETLGENSADSPQPVADTASAIPTPAAMGDWLLGFVTDFAGLPETVSLDTPFYEMGLDSAALLALSQALEKPLDARFYPTMCYEHGSVAALAAYLVAAGHTVPVQGAQVRPSVAERSATAVSRMAVSSWADAPLTMPEVRHSVFWQAFAPAQSVADMQVWDGTAKIDGLVWDVAAGQDPAQLLTTALNLAKLLIRQGHGLGLIVLAQGAEAAALVPFLRSLSREVPRICGLVLSGDIPDLSAEITSFAAQQQQGFAHVAYHAGKRQIAALTLQSPALPSVLALQGTVVLTGGTGGIAQSLLDSLFAQGHRAFSLIARNPASADLSARLDALAQQGCEVQVLQADVTQSDQMRTAWRKIKVRFGTVAGVLHCAGVLRDGLIAAKSVTDAREVLAAKLDALRLLDDLSQNEPLAFFATCGSVTGVFGNLGQSDYAFANGAMAGFLDMRAANPNRPGTSICFDWPFWAEGGMALASARQDQLARETGLVALPTDVAQAAFVAKLGLPGAVHRAMPLMIADEVEFERFLAAIGLPLQTQDTAQDTAQDQLTLPVSGAAATQPRPGTGIAVIGMAGEYPGAPTLAAFWQNLRDGVDSISKVPADRWDHGALFSEKRGERGKIYTDQGGFIADHDRFDAEFFNIPPREAKLLDPQERRFLQVAWAAVESAGLNPRQLKGKTIGVFVGAMWGQYQLNGPDADGSVAASIFSAVANRVSYSLNLTGPSMAVDSMCSSSLTAVHLAMESLSRGECDMAIVGGVNLMTHPHKFQYLCQNQMLSEDSRCRSFGEGGSGYVPGEGVGAVVLKPLEQAILDCDPVQAVLLASAVNHGGRAAGMTVPNPEAQAQVIRAAHSRANTRHRVSYIEAHGTGTALGDPIEVAGLVKAFDGAGLQTCALGSVKSNIGHLEGAAGIAALTKTVLQLRNSKIAPSLHADRLNPNLTIEGTPFMVATQGRDWVGEDRVAGLSAFGAGGSNAHIVLGAAPAIARTTVAEGPAVLVVSARNTDALRAYVEAWALYLETSAKGIPFAAIAATSVTGREAFECRLALVAETATEAGSALRGWLAEGGVGAALIAPTHADSAAAKAAKAFAAGETIGASPACPFRTEVPTYPFAGARYALQPAPTAEVNADATPFLGHMELRPDGVRFSKTWNLSEPLLADHVIAGDPLMPAAMMLQTLRSALAETGGGAMALAKARIGAPFAVGGGARQLNCEVFQHAGGLAVELAHEPSGAIVMQAIAENAGAQVAQAAPVLRGLPTDPALPIGDFYDRFKAQGLVYGQRFRCLTGVAKTATGIWARLDLPDDQPWRRAVMALDAAMQAVVLNLGDISADETIWLPAEFDTVHWFGDLAKAVWVHVSPLISNSEMRTYAIALTDAEGTVLWQAGGFTLRPRPVPSRPVAVAHPTTSADRGALQERLRDKLAEMLASESGLAAEKVRRVDGFTDLGVDSVMVMNMTFKLEQVFGTLPKSLFFEHGGVADLANWLADTHPQKAATFGGVRPGPASAGLVPSPVMAAKPLQSLRRTVAKAAIHGAEPLAIIGMAGRFPGADDVDALWDNLAKGHNAVSEIPMARWPAHLFANPDGRKGNICGFGGFLDDVAGFDAAFFGMTPVDAKRADPAERLVLESAWGAVENAGYSRKALKGRAVGVFVASMWQQYQHFGLDAALGGDQMTAVSLLSSTASRISGMLGVTGPCLALDTMCSGSLTALHLARQAIANGDCDAAVVAGVNLSLHPHKYLTLSAGGFLSRKGHCASFGAEADGYVPGEGAAAIVVKSLSKALADGDPIHGVVLGTAINHIGGTNGTTVPSASAQTAVIRQAIESAGIEAGQISYVECHGTGTALGDPIELEGLNAALSANAPHVGCHIGSVKSNIGHAEAAAGVIGMIKVLLQFRAEKLAPTLHIEKVNPALDLGNTPFTLVDQLQDWQIGKTKFAAVSAFGAGGSNANVILQSAPQPSAADLTMTKGPRLFVFSATSDGMLRAQLEQTALWMARNPDACPEAVAATLALGREDQSVRLAVVADSLQDVQGQLAAFLAGKTLPHGAYSSAARQGSAKLSDFFDDAQGRDLISGLLAGRSLAKLAQFWAGGVPVDWQPLFAPGQRRLSMPGSVFDRVPLMLDHGLERYAVRFENTSDLSEQSYHIEMPAGHPVIADHVIDGKRQVSLALMTRLVHEALGRADTATDWQVSLDVKRPWFVADRLSCDIRMTPGRAGLDVWLDADGVTIASGRAKSDAKVPAPFDMPCQTAQDGAAFYDDFDRDGYAYGAAYRRVSSYGIAADAVAAELTALGSDDPFGADRLCVGAMDAALQLTRPLLESRSAAGWLPVAISLCVTGNGASVARVIAKTTKQTGASAHFAIQWQSQSGEVIAFAEAELSARPAVVDMDRSLGLCRVWQPVKLGTRGALPRPLFVLGDMPDAEPVSTLAEVLTKAQGDRLCLVLPDHDMPDILPIWDFVRAARTAGHTHLTLLFTAKAMTPHLAGLIAWLRALTEECPTINGRILIAPALPDEATLAAALDQDRVLLRVTDAGWETPSVVKAVTNAGQQDVGDVAGQVVLITGGAGGLGRVMARHLARRGAHPVMVGRSPADASVAGFVAALRQTGVEAVYYSADIADPQQAEALIRRIQLRFGRIDGVIHAAGVTSDAWLMDQTAAGVRSVLAPKVLGTDRLIELLAGFAPRWVAAFSSISGFLGNPGQTDYSYANAYMCEALRLGMAPDCAVINLSWPLWKNIGMQVDPKMLDIIDKRYGMQPLPVATGLAWFDHALELGAGDYLVTYGAPDRIARWLGTKELGVPEIPAKAEASPAPLAKLVTPPLVTPSVVFAPSQSAEATARAWVAEAVHSETQITAEKLDWQRPIDQFGISSVMSTSIVAFLETRAGTSLPATLMFECANWGEVADWLVSNGHANTAPASAAEQPAPAPKAAVQLAKSSKPKSRFAKALSDVAITGAACRMPGADSMAEFWEILANGRDMVTPIPADRWDWPSFAGADAAEAMKGGFLKNVKRFDYPFFGIFHKEARSMDPQERLVLETAWHALEDAGIAPSSLSDKPVGVYMGAMWTQYQMLARELWQTLPEEAAANGSASAIANRLSFLLNLAGPSLTLDTMCSSSLVALKLARDALRSGEIDMAIVGGVNTSLHPFKYHQLERAQFLSPEGRCGAFSQGGDGYVPSEGVGVVVLRRLEDAEAAGDRVRAVVRGIGVSHGGRANGFTVPRPQRQAAAIRAALQDGDIAPGSVSYVEAHGTGTALGDPIEMTGLKSAYLQGGAFPLRIGSVKANIGHTESAAGMASLCKVLLQMQHGQLAPSIHADPANPDLGITGTSIEVQKMLADWVCDGPRRAGISGFGAGGTNVHVILEQPCSLSDAAPAQHRDEVILLSARDKVRLAELARALRDQITDDTVLAPLAAASQLGRDAQKTRLAIVAGTVAALRQKLDQWLRGEQAALVWTGTVDMPVICDIADRNLGDSADACSLARDWAEHGTVDWSALWPENTARADLPLYPFEEIDVWLGDTAGINPADLIFAPRPAAMSVVKSAVPDQVAATATQTETSPDIVALLGALLSTTFRMDPDDLSPDMTFDRIGMDSVAATDCANALSAQLGFAVDATWFFNHPTIRQLATALEAEMPSAQNVAAIPQPTLALEAALPAPTEDLIAVVGMSGAFAGAVDLESYWRNLVQGVDSVTEVSPDRWDINAFHSADHGAAGKTISRRMGQMNGIDMFDPAAFNLMPDEVEAMDPQQRLFLKHCAKALDDAAIAPERIDGSRCGVFAGTMTGSYRALLDANGQGFDALTMLGNHAAALPARVAFWLNLTGPSLAVDTACSSSLVSVHLACQAIRNGECNMALAGGVFVSPGPQEMISSSQAGMLSSSGSCKTFDDSADGIALGEGVGVLVLKPLREALAHGDPIHAVLRGSGINQDGRTNGLTAPNALSQARLISEVLARSGLGADDIDYVECHGTGTKLGDPVEVEGLKRALGDKRSLPLAIGSVKPNVGHCYAAAGVASLMKVILSLRHGALPPSIHFAKANSLIDFDKAGLRVNAALTDWPRGERPRIAAVSAFGYSGTNAHMIVEEAPQKAVSAVQPPAQSHVLPLSARKPGLVVAQAKALALALRDRPVALADLAATLQQGRRVEACRWACVVPTLDAAIAALETMSEADVNRVRDAKGTALVGDAAALADAWMTGAPRLWPTPPHAPRAAVPGKHFDEKRIWPAAANGAKPDVAAPMEIAAAPPLPAPKAANGNDWHPLNGAGRKATKAMPKAHTRHMTKISQIEFGAAG